MMVEMGINIRYELAKTEDLQAVYDVVQHTIKTIYPKYYPMEAVDFFCELHNKDAILKDIENGDVIVLKVDGKIAATGSFVENHITRIYVLPQYQKKGYGTFIVKSIEDQIRNNYDKAVLDASLPAAALYEKLGFSTIRHEKLQVENKVILTYEIMEKILRKDTANINNDRRIFACRDIGMAEKLEYKRATPKDIEELVRTRILVLRAANKLPDDADMSFVEQKSYSYYKRALENGDHIAYLIYDNGKFVGAGGVSFYQVMPTFHNPSGKKAYIMNMYTAPGYRRQGIAFHTLDLLVKDAKERCVSQITLEATDIGRPLYEKYGFIKAEDEMELVQ